MALLCRLFMRFLMLTFGIFKLFSFSMECSWMAPLTPAVMVTLLILKMYIPTHPHDIHLILEIQKQIQNLMAQYPTHHTIMARDLNRDILLKGRTHNGIPSPPNQNSHEWTHFTNNIGLNAINNHNSFTRQGGYNYTSTSHIDGFYSNLPNHNTLKCHTITNVNQNSDHYPVHTPTNLQYHSHKKN